jgi:hypothetical protein
MNKNNKKLPNPVGKKGPSAYQAGKTEAPKTDIVYTSKKKK